MTIRYSELAAAVKADLEAIPGIGIVHAYERQAVDLKKFIQLFQSPTGKILGWETTRAAAPERYAGATIRQHQFQLQGYMGLQDADGSSIQFQDLCDTICDAFREPVMTVPGCTYQNSIEKDQTPAQVVQITDRMFGGVLCHTAIITLAITERIIQ